MKGKIVGMEGGTESPIMKLTVEVEKAELAGQVFKGWDLIDFHLLDEKTNSEKI